MTPPKIHVLPAHVANQIAAGEVVERPESVVKELVENALDAGATRIRVEVEGGGTARLRVLDDGHGMTPQDAMTALLRHATSKVATIRDLESIETLGFRGEALPSIRSVSRFSIRTRTRDADEGVRITAHGADEPVLEPCAASPGTEITVDDLFFNVPARRKFLKQPGTELHRIRELIDRIALGWPEVHFTVASGGKVVQDYPTASGLEARILSVLGREVCRRLHHVSLAIGEHRVEGFASEPTFFKSSNAWQYTYINGRFVRDKVIQHGLTQAYSELLQRGQFPAAVLYVFVPPESVDINVHPSKAEVRFVESQTVHGLVLRGVRLMLADAPWSGLPAQGRSSGLTAQGSPLGGENTSLSFLQTLFPERTATAPPWTQAPVAVPDQSGADSLPPDTSPATAPAAEEPVRAEPSGAGEHARMPARGAGRQLGLIQGRFFVLDQGSGLGLVDVPAAATLTLALRLVEQAGDHAPSQALLFPEPVTLNARDLQLAQSPLLHALGFGVEPFGGSDVLVSALPGELPGEPAPAAMLRAALGPLAAGRRELADVAQAVAQEAMAHAPLDEALVGRTLAALDTLAPERAATVRAHLSLEALERLFPSR